MSDQDIYDNGITMPQQPEPPMPPTLQIPRRPRVSAPRRRKASKGGLQFPVGSVIMFAGNVGIPSDLPKNITNVETMDWMVCDGRELNRVKFPDLYDAIGYLYGGSGDRNTFNIPNYQGYFLRGLTVNSDVDKGYEERKKNDTKGSTGTDKGIGSQQDPMVQKHQHQYDQYSKIGGVGGDVPNAAPALTMEPLKPCTTGLFEDDKCTQSLDGKETRPVNIYVYYLIRCF